MYCRFFRTPRRPTPKGPLMPGDRIVQIDDQPIEQFGQLQDFLVAHADEDLTVTVARLKQGGGKEDKSDNAENVQVIVPKSPMKQFGLVMEMGPIAAVQDRVARGQGGNSSRRSVEDGRRHSRSTDPMRLPDELHKRAGAEVTLGLERGGKTAAAESQALVRAALCPVGTAG